MSDLELAFRLADAADAQTFARWSPRGVAASTKSDGTPVTQADVAAEQAILDILHQTQSGDGFLGEELGERLGSNSRRWIVDGIDGTRYFAAGAPSWGTLIALEEDGEIVLGVSSSPAQSKRWWATRGGGAFVGSTHDRAGARQVFVSTTRSLSAERVTTLPAHERLEGHPQRVIESLAGGVPVHHPWSQQNRVAEGEIDLCVWLAGDIWDHAAPSIIVEEAGGRFSDHFGGRRLDTRTAIYSNGILHDRALAALRE